MPLLPLPSGENGAMPSWVHTRMPDGTRRQHSPAQPQHLLQRAPVQQVNWGPLQVTHILGHPVPRKCSVRSGKAGGSDPGVHGAILSADELNGQRGERRSLTTGCSCQASS